MCFFYLQKFKQNLNSWISRINNSTIYCVCLMFWSLCRVLYKVYRTSATSFIGDSMTGAQEHFCRLLSPFSESVLVKKYSNRKEPNSKISFTFFVLLKFVAYLLLSCKFLGKIDHIIFVLSTLAPYWCPIHTWLLFPTELYWSHWYTELVTNNSDHHSYTICIYYMQQALQRPMIMLLSEKEKLSLREVNMPKIVQLSNKTEVSAMSVWAHPLSFTQNTPEEENISELSEVIENSQVETIWNNLSFGGLL